MTRISILQFEILCELQSDPAKSVTQLAARVEKLRPSVSRSLKNLKQQGLVVYEGRAWRLTQSGEEEIANQTEKLQEAMAHMHRSFSAITRVSLVPPETSQAFEVIAKSMSMAISEMVTPMSSIQKALDQNLRLLGPSIEPLVQAQKLNSALIKSAVGAIKIPEISTVLHSHNRSLAHAIDDSFALRALTSTRIPNFPISRLDTFAPVSVHFPEIASAVESMNEDHSTAIRSMNSSAADFYAPMPVLVPPSATAAYSRSIRVWLEEDSTAGQVEGYPLLDSHARIHAGLALLGAELVEMHQGAWIALGRGGPDSQRHAAVSMRELLRILFKRLVPDEVLSEEGNTRIKARIRNFLGGSRSSAAFATHLSLGLDGMYDQLNAYTHSHRADRDALHALMTATDGVLLFVLHHVHRSKYRN